MNRKTEGVSIKPLRQDSEFIVLTLFLILVTSTTSFKNPGLSDYVGIASTIVLIAAIGLKLIANWYNKKD
ncbi:hypothetical protein BK764_16930 [Bacillus thuringiensis serovar israelensis]|uniref:Uncharacterized protein n=3 Tax=Bacillus thuringiensis TaxID=1428 RepID=A0AB35PHC1_BACTU|nr:MULTISPECIES: hypothetical protein [Bacillus cereus group]AFQ28018.1 hypothetical protein BTF1_19245 [Bacillus thuringiensis HD-789]AJH05671.1 putative membrane protein [Bacillus thuringiensis HD1002]AND26067.1 hypothetical protein ATN07_21570 [Bacillus thuringiensis serovar israelensis]KAA0787469.1 hypothetical protein DN406_23005 [Bacillus sp. BB56-3]KRD75354.1 hypothetical protein ASE53_23510 [Bacillus sp. Root11]KRD92747.1 hypothetical protein ASE54_30215 [Bacillus sp. Root131]OTX7639